MNGERMRRTQFRGNTTYTLIADDGSLTEHRADLTITQGIRAVFTLIEIDGLGQGLVKMRSNGSFVEGTFASDNTIYFTSGRVTGNSDRWEGRYEAHETQGGRLCIVGSILVNRVKPMSA